MKPWKNLSLAAVLAAALTLGSVPAIAAQAGDTTPPVLLGVTADRDSAREASEITLKVSASDNQSGLAYLSVRLRDPDSKRSLYATSLAANCYNAKDKTYHMTLKIPKGTPAGTYELYRVSLTDGASNRQSYRQEELLGREEKGSVLGDALLEQEFSLLVTEAGGEADEAAPTLAEVQVNRTYVRHKEPVQVFVDAADEGSGIKRIKVEFSNSHSGELYSINLGPDQYSEKRGGYVDSFTIRAQEPDGWFELYSVTLTDERGNRRIYGSEDLLYEYNDNGVDHEALPNETGFCVDNPVRDDD